jgi:uncharacterized phage protein (TIGR01671 family)
MKEQIREHKFRGQRYDTKEWIYGSLLENDIIVVKGATDVDEDYIGFSDEWSSVLPETVGEFTGLLDKNGKEIFEGDIVKYNFITTERQAIFKIVWCRYGWCLVDNDEVEYLDSAEWHCGEAEIIGNIHDGVKE